MDFKQRLEEARAQVLKGFELKGMPFSFTPEINYQPTSFSGSPTALANVGGLAGQRKQMANLLLGQIIPLVMEREYGIPTNKTYDILGDLRKFLSRDLSTIPLSDQNSVTAYKLFEDEAKKHPEIIPRVLAHEFWHLREMREGVYITHPLLVEATAEYAAGLVSNMPTPPFSDEKLFEEAREDIKKALDTLVYIKGAIYLQEALIDESKPLERILNPTFRAEQQKRLVDKAVDLTVAAISS